jgi:outer membrane protein
MLGSNNQEYLKVKMKVMKFGLGAVALALMAPAVRAQAPVGPRPNVAIINIQQAIIATKDGEKARSDIETRFGPRAKDMEGRQAEIAKLKDQLAKGSNTMAQDQRDKIARDIDDKTKRLQWDSEDLQNEYQQEQQKLVNDIGQRMIAVIDEIAKEKTLMLVLDVSTQQSPVLWAANGIDISREAVERYDKKYGLTIGTGSPSAPAAGGASPGAAPAKPPVAAPRPPVTAPAKKQ